MLLADGVVWPALIPAGWTMVCNGAERLSVRNNLWAAFRHAVDRDSSRLLYFEDDVIPCLNAVERMATITIPDDCSLITFHDTKEHAPNTARGLYRHDPYGDDGQGFCGCQAMAIPRRMLDYLITCDPFTVWKSLPQKHGDQVLGYFIDKSPWPRFATHVPSLVKHVGEVSIAHPSAPLSTRRGTVNFAGDRFDALGLTF